MPAHKQFVQAIDNLSSLEQETVEDVARKTIEDYRRLNEKCDKVIVKVKSRKTKKTIQQSGE